MTCQKQRGLPSLSAHPPARSLGWLCAVPVKTTTTKSSSITWNVQSENIKFILTDAWLHYMLARDRTRCHVQFA